MPSSLSTSISTMFLSKVYFLTSASSSSLTSNLHTLNDYTIVYKFSILLTGVADNETILKPAPSFSRYSMILQ